MKNNKICAIDVDLTVVDTFTPWMHWFYALTDGESIRNVDGCYNLVPEMNEIIKAKNLKFDPFSFWKRKDLYDDLSPIAGSLQTVNLLKERGWDVVFVSTCTPEHTKSKMDFLGRNFPNADGFISTDKKFFVDYTLIIDDSLSNIHQSMRNKSADHLLFTGVRTDGMVLDRFGIPILDNWSSFNRVYGHRLGAKDAA